MGWQQHMRVRRSFPLQRRDDIRVALLIGMLLVDRAHERREALRARLDVALVFVCVAVKDGKKVVREQVRE